MQREHGGHIDGGIPAAAYGAGNVRRQLNWELLMLPGGVDILRKWGI
jgi:hypothetical protein